MDDAVHLPRSDSWQHGPMEGQPSCCPDERLWWPSTCLLLPLLPRQCTRSVPTQLVAMRHLWLQQKQHPVQLMWQMLFLFLCTQCTRPTLCDA